MEESYQDRQENEKSSLMAIYGDQITIINSKSDFWEPTECILFLTAQQSYEIQKSRNAATLQLNIICSTRYPDCVPEISINAVKGLSKENSERLLVELKELSKNLVGEVMIFELAQHTEKFLFQNQSTGYESFYEEMISRKRYEEQQELKKKIDDEEKNRELIMSEIYSKQQAVKKALRRQKHNIDFFDTSLSNDADNCNVPDKFEENNLGVCSAGDNEVNRDISQVNCEDGDWKTNCEDFSPWAISKHWQSRFHHEFEYIKWLGRGAFGDVIKVRNKLDDGFYAVKRIQLKAANKQLNKRITREVKLLSRLNHENVVRYYNSWIEVVDLPSNTLVNSETSPKKKSLGNAAVSMLPRNEAFSHDWNASTNSSECVDEDDDDSWISFKVNSNEGEHDSLSTIDETDSQEAKIKSLTYMYIQMELCEKNTLRTAIDDSLYADSVRVWRLFREIIEGLSHIHQQGIIHRDLKPVNIFIGNGDRVKIGDFGLATTIIFQKQSAPRGEYSSMLDSQGTDCDAIVHKGVPPSILGDSSHTGLVGTALYVAPELESSQSKVSYNEKVDIYSLGVIFFEMCHPPWRTKMEQILIISELRKNEPYFPETFPHKKESPQHALIRGMLNHNAKDRPSSHELLTSKFIPPPLLEESEMKDMISRTMSNPQSKDYKYLIASCFNQVTPVVIDATYDMSSGHSGRFMLLLESASNIFRNIFLRHGAICLLPPLFTPSCKKAETAVCLMTRWGGIVYATHDLRTPFARYLARNNHLTHFKRYAIDKVYRERRVLGLHPKEMYECAFDIVTPTPEDLMPECELVFVISEIMSEFPSLLNKNCSIRLNHSLIIQAILMHCGVESAVIRNINTSIFKVKNEFDSKKDVELLFKSLDLNENIKLSLVNIMMIQGSLEEVKSQLLSIITNRDLVHFCLQGFSQLQSLITYCKTLDVQFNFTVSMNVVQNAHYYSGVLFQVVIDQKSKQKNIDEHILICGGRYDHLIKTCRQAQPIPNKGNQCVAGFCLSIDKFISCLNDYKKLVAFDVLICATGQSHITSDKLFIIRDLWKFGIRTSFTHSAQSLEELQDYCQEFGIPHIVILKDSDTKGFARVKSWNKGKFSERKILLSELLDYLLKALKNPSQDQSVKAEVKSGGSVENANITFISMDKLTITSKKRYEIQISNSLCSICEKFSSKAKIDIIGLFLEEDALKMLAFCAESSSPDQDVNCLLKKYPRNKKYIMKVLDQLPSFRRVNNPPVLILYSLVDNSFKIIL